MTPAHSGGVFFEGRGHENRGQKLHVIRRGNNRGAIFFAVEDHARYHDSLAWSARRYVCRIHAYVLLTQISFWQQGKSVYSKPAKFISRHRRRLCRSRRAGP